MIVIVYFDLPFNIFCFKYLLTILSVSFVSVITATAPTSTPSPSQPPSNDNNTMDSSGSDKCLLTYNGSACTSHLCSGQNTSLFDSLTESRLSGLIEAFSSLVINQPCRSEQSKIEDFLCRVAFQPCDDDNNIHLPNRTTCESIRDTICPTEWGLLQNTMYSSLLPNCNLLPDVSTPPMCGKL